MRRQRPEAHIDRHGPFVVTRRLSLAARTPVKEGASVLDAIAHLPGVVTAELDADKTRLVVIYDATMTGFDEIEAVLDQYRVKLAQGPWCRCKASLYRFMDANARGNAKAAPASCCSSPKGIYANQRHRQD